MEKNNSWMSISDLMSALMMIFLFIAIAFMYQLQNAKNIYKLELNKALHTEFDDDLSKWKAEITPDNIIRFNAPFTAGSDVLPEDYQATLSDFFPRYVHLLSQPRFKKEIDEIRVEGHTSNGWGSVQNTKLVYLNNMELSQRRATNVLQYCYLLNDGYIRHNNQWLENKLRANGMAYAKLLYKDNTHTVQDAKKSRRVEFKVLTKEEK